MHSDVKEWLSKGQFFQIQEKKIFYITQGDGEVILLIHGYPYSSFEWKEVAQVLSKSNRVILIDLLGFGFSDKPLYHNYTYEDYVLHITLLMQHLGVRRVHVVAHDLGASVAQELIAQQKDRRLDIEISSIAFVNGGLFMDVYKPRMIQRLLSQSPDWCGRFINQLLSRSLIEKSICQLFGKQSRPSQDLLNQLWDVLTYNEGKNISYRLGRLVFDKYRYQHRWISAMQETMIRICYINGPADANSGEHMARHYEQLIPNPKVFRLNQDVGHWPHLEDSVAFLEAYHDFQQLHRHA